MAHYTKRRNYYGGNSGYVGYSMSVRAAEAREDGKFPKTDFCREYGISPKLLAALVEAGVVNDDEWHHTSKYGNRTTFYEWENHEVAEWCRGQRATKNRDHKAIAAEAKEVNEYYNTLEMMDVWREREASRWNAAQEEAIMMASDEWVLHVYRSKYSDTVRKEFYRMRDIDYLFNEDGELWKGELIF